jgi:hypothetical protein
MSAGRVAAGAAPAGYAPLSPGAVVYKPVAAPPAILLDLAERDAVLDADGRTAGMDPEDQQVALAFGAERGSIKHAKHIGNDFRAKLPSVNGAPLQAAAERIAREATPFDQLLASGAVTLLGVTVVRPRRGAALITVSYKRRGETRARSATVGTS